MPGIPGDAGPNAIDWAMINKEKRWGGILLQVRVIHYTVYIHHSVVQCTYYTQCTVPCICTIVHTVGGHVFFLGEQSLFSYFLKGLSHITYLTFRILYSLLRYSHVSWWFWWSTNVGNGGGGGDSLHAFGLAEGYK